MYSVQLYINVVYIVIVVMYYRFCRWNVYISLNAFPDVSPLSQFPIADKVLEIMIRYSSLNCISLASLDRIPPYHISATFAYLLTDSP